MFRPVTLFFSVLLAAPLVLANAYKDYDNDFLDPSYILAKNFNTSTAASQQSIIQWADFLAAQGPWCE
jgi:nitrogen fixation protein FixH